MSLDECFTADYNVDKASRPAVAVNIAAGDETNFQTPAENCVRKNNPFFFFFSLFTYFDSTVKCRNWRHSNPWRDRPSPSDDPKEIFKFCNVRSFCGRDGINKFQRITSRVCQLFNETLDMLLHTHL